MRTSTTIAWSLPGTVLWLFCGLSLLCTLPAAASPSQKAGTQGAASVNPEQAKLPPIKEWLKDFHLQLRGRMFAGFRATFQEENSFNEFDLHEFQLRLRTDWKRMLGVEMRIEVLRSAQPQSLFGIDGDAYIVRLQQAWGFGRVAFWKDRIELEARFGFLFDNWIELAQEGYQLRDVSLLISQGGDFFAPTDLGFSAGIKFWHGLVEARVSFTNGEGTNRAEQNAGKNTTITATVRPLVLLNTRLLGYKPELSLHFVYRDGSLGTGLAANHRLGGALNFTLGPYNVGLEYVNANGWRGDGALQADGLGAWLSAAFYKHYVGLSARYDRLNTNLNVDDAVRQRITVGLYTDAFQGFLWRGFQRFRLYALYQYEDQGQNSGPLPGFPEAGTAHRVLLILSVYAGVQI